MDVGSKVHVMGSTEVVEIVRKYSMDYWIIRNSKGEEKRHHKKRVFEAKVDEAVEPKAEEISDEVEPSKPIDKKDLIDKIKEVTKRATSRGSKKRSK